MLRHSMSLLIAGLSLLACPSFHGTAAEMAMGFRVGEVTHDSAIVWTRVTRDAERKWDGFREPKKRQPKQDEYIASEVNVNDRDGATPGAVGQVRVVYSTKERLDDTRATEWVTVAAKHDFSHQFRIADLRPATRYHLKVEARDSSDTDVSAVASGSFGTPAMADQWQDVSFGVVTGQSYWDLDDRSGYHIYPAMQKLNLDFLVPTGDTVYLDSEAPRARTVELARYHWQRIHPLPMVTDVFVASARRVPPQRARVLGG